MHIFLFMFVSINIFIFLCRKLSEKDKCDYIVSTDANHLQVKHCNA